MLNLSAEEFKHIRQKIQIVFQDPHSSLNPAFTVFGSLQDPLKLYGVKTNAERRKIIGDLLEAVNMRREQMDNYPHEFSGGQRQRICIARSLALNPELVICDEPVSALDVSIQAQVINLLMDLQERLGLTYLFIAHDLSVVRHISTRVAVMYLGRIVEIADRDTLFTAPKHPYTKALLNAVPEPDPEVGSLKSNQLIIGEVPSVRNPPAGCHFHPRCPQAMEICRTDTPEMTRIEGATVACHLYPQ